MSKRMTAYLGSGLFVLAGLAIMVLQPLSHELDSTGQLILGAVLITLALWIFRPFNLAFSIGGFFLAAFSLAVGLAPSVVFSGFIQSAIWTLIPAFLFGHALEITGLGKRIALGIIILFKPGYFGLVIAFVVIGVVLSTLTPSIVVRIAIVMPIALQCCRLCKLKPGSRENSLVLLTAFAMALVPGTGWLTGSLRGPIVQGMVNVVSGMEGLITFDSWLSVLFVPMELVTVLLVVGSLIFLKPRGKLPKGTIDSILSEERSPISRREIVTAVILVLVFVCFLTNGIHHLPDAAVCLSAVVLLFICGVLKTEDLGSGVNWDLTIFIAMALSLTSIFAATGISAWLAGIVVPALAPVADNPWLFVYAITIAMFAWRFVDVAFFIPTMAIMTPLLPIIASTYNISPFVWVVVFVMAGNCFFMAYTNMFAIVGQSLTQDRPWTPKHLAIYGSIYCVACLITLAFVLPYWISIGYFG